jgi:hypothetical protein
MLSLESERLLLRPFRADDFEALLAMQFMLKATSEIIGDGSLFLLSAEHRQGEIGFVFHLTTTVAATQPRRRGCYCSSRSKNSACTA